MKKEVYKKYKDVVEAWANGAVIQTKYSHQENWKDIVDPDFDSFKLEYRVKPNTKFDGQFRADRLYKLKYSGEICHVYNREGIVPFSEITCSFVHFVGTVDTRCGLRNIFYVDNPSNAYIMYSTKVDYVVAEYDLDGNLIQEYV